MNRHTEIVNIILFIFSGKNLNIGLSRNDFHDVRIDHKGSRYGHGSWKRGRWNNSGITNGGFDGFLEGRDEEEDQTVGIRDSGSHTNDGK